MVSELERRLRIKAELQFENEAVISAKFAKWGHDIAEAAFNEKQITQQIDRMKAATSNVNDKGDYLGQNTAAMQSKQQATEAKNKIISVSVQALEGTAQNMMGILKNSFNIISTIYERLKSASPLLQTIETLFNLAVQLFFMPLGTRLATEMLPAVMALVDNVLKIWDWFGEDTSLGDLLSKTIELGAKYFGDYFKSLGDKLSSQDGILGAIGNVLSALGNFIQTQGEKLVDLILKITSWILNNLPGILGTVVGLLIASKTLQIIQIGATIAAAASAAGHTPWGAVIGAGAIASVAGIAAGMGASYAVRAAEGGYFPAKSGGYLVNLAEGGEGETVVPDSKKVDFAKQVMSGYSPSTPSGVSASSSSPQNVTLNLYINGYTDTNLEDKIVRVVNEKLNLSRLRGGLS